MLLFDEAKKVHDEAAAARLEAVRARDRYLIAEQRLADTRLVTEINLIQEKGGEKELGANAEARARAISQTLLEDVDYLAALSTRGQFRLAYELAEARAISADTMAKLYRAYLQSLATSALSATL